MLVGSPAQSTASVFSMTSATSIMDDDMATPAPTATDSSASPSQGSAMPTTTGDGAAGTVAASWSVSGLGLVYALFALR